jgi:hypothetical protein
MTKKARRVSTKVGTVGCHLVLSDVQLFQRRPWVVFAAMILSNPIFIEPLLARRFDDAGAPMTSPMLVPRRFLRRPRLSGFGASSAGCSARLGMALAGPCRRIVCPPASLRRACRQRPRSRLPARRGCTRSSTTAFRVIARKNGERVRLYSRPGNDLTDRFPLIVEALARLRARSCSIDGEAVSCGDDGIASFERMARLAPRL